jgi:hypothetical protein
MVDTVLFHGRLTHAHWISLLTQLYYTLLVLDSITSSLQNKMVTQYEVETYKFYLKVAVD